MAQIPRPRRPVIKLPVYSLSHSASGCMRIFPINISSSPRPKDMRAAAWIIACATQGFVSTSPIPVIPSSV